MPSGTVLEKFKGRETCPTWNLNGNVQAAKALLNTHYMGNPGIPMRRIVPKSVCHGMIYTQDIHAQVPSGVHPGLDLFKQGMDVYFRGRPEGKALHDVLATVAALDPGAFTWVEACPFRDDKTGEWGCERPPPPSMDIDRSDAYSDTVFALVRASVGAFIKTLSMRSSLPASTS
jgi:hypothetical protein